MIEQVQPSGQVVQMKESLSPGINDFWPFCTFAKKFNAATG
jgi:hypothetical protein